MSQLNYNITQETTSTKCVICFNVIEREIYLEQCQHQFCYGCIMRWSEKSHTCPQCRQSFENFYELQKTGNTTHILTHNAPAVVNFKKEKHQIAMIDLDNTYYEYILEQIDIF